MYHRTDVKVSGLPEMTSQNKVTFFFDSSLMGDDGLMRNDTVGLSEMKGGMHKLCYLLHIMNGMG